MARHAEGLAPERRGGLQRESKRGATRLTPGGRGHGCHERLALGSAVVRESVDLANLLARKQR